MADARHTQAGQLELPLGTEVSPTDASAHTCTTRQEKGATATRLTVDRLTVALSRQVAADGEVLERAHQLGGALRGHLQGRLLLRVHENRSTMVSFRRDDERVELRVHRIFLDADAEMVRALAEYTRTRSSRSTRAIDRFVRRHGDELGGAGDTAGTRPLQPQGQVHDLKALYDELNETYFDGQIEAAIGWGRGTTSARRNSIRMGAYFEETKTILVHPALDRAEVPRLFVAFVVYHEMLHQAVPASRDAKGRRQVHSPEFRRRERLFVDFDRVRAWERRHLSLLLQPAAQTDPPDASRTIA